jgi:signal transduction histidine kinase
MAAMSPEEKAHLQKVESALVSSEAKLRLAQEEMERHVQERTAELITSNQILQMEIAERKRAEKEILEVTHEEQRRIGSQLHDGLCQELTGILMFAKGLTQKMEKDHSLDVAELKKISDLLHGAVSQARNTARGLYPGELEGTSLMHSLQELASNTEKVFGVSCRFDCPEPVMIGDNNTATHLYKIVQEGIANAVNHGKAKSILVSLTQNGLLPASGGTVTLIVKDDGAGFVLNNQESNGIGLKIMKYRADVIGASFRIMPNSPHGVLLECHLKGHA